MMKQMKIQIRTLSPVVLTTHRNAGLMTESQNSFSGSVLRGVLADRYIREQKLSMPHEDADFRRLFFSALRFVPANPLTVSGRAFALPKSLQKSKDGQNIIDTFLQKPSTDKAYKSCKGLGSVSDSRVSAVCVRKNVSLHMSRNGESERLSGKSNDGHIYNYESLNAGQMFEGVVFGSEEDLEALREALHLEDGGMEAFIGRSKYTEYGKCRLSFGDIEAIKANVKGCGKILYIRLESAFIPAPVKASCAENALAELCTVMEKETGHQFHIGKVFASAVCIDNFVGVWHMKRPSQLALEAGSVFALERTDGDWDEGDIQVLQHIGYAGLGQRTEEGFGQLRFWPAGSAWKPGKALYPLTADKACEVKSGEVRRIAGEILLARILEQVRIRASEDAGKLQPLKGLAHLFARLESTLGPREHLSETAKKFRQELERVEEKSPQGQMKKHLQNIRFYGGNLWEALCDKNKLPFKKEDWVQALPAKASALMKEIQFRDSEELQGAVFYEYWLWLFRHARKRAVQIKEEAE